ncbi:secreted RxLR effector protein 161-like [Humulus lupulus]|uniref:secreted RxLR effector protein 161-like n=1 Tax=Humulus lupulus TaxID=3486 RepID=UPI002B4094E1|nr:secreted RxLR effector protein 161-like [Humulus lupulus]
MYAQICTRLDIAFVVNVLGRYLSDPGRDHWVENIRVVGYSDSDFGGSMDDLKSTSGYIFTLAGAAISWKSVKQTLITSSTIVAVFFTKTNKISGASKHMKIKYLTVNDLVKK